jgi:hypothetical protein
MSVSRQKKYNSSRIISGTNLFQFNPEEDMVFIDKDMPG